MFRPRSCCALVTFLLAVTVAVVAQSAAAPAEHEKLTIDQIVTLSKAGVPDEEIIERIEATRSVFDLGVEEILRLNKGGVSVTVIKAMRAAGSPAPRGDNESSAPASVAGTRDILLVVDSSGSMAGKTLDGATKITVAKQTLAKLIQQLPDNINVGLLAFGHRHSSRHPKTCADIELIAPVVRTDKVVLTGKVDQLYPHGKTPLAKSLLQAAEILRGLGGDREKAVVVVTDGLETCGGDPLAAAARLTQLGFKVELYVIGFDLIPTERAALQEVAKAGRGKFLNAENAADLEKAFEIVHRELIVRAPPVKRKVIVVENIGPGYVRSIGNKEEGIGNFYALLLKREDTLLELPPVGEEHGLTVGEFWGLGARVLEVAEESPAAEAGLMPGDLVVQADDEPVQSAGQLRTLLGTSPSEDQEDLPSRLRVARFTRVGGFYSRGDPTALEVPSGVYGLVAVEHVPGLLSDYAKQTGSWLLLDQASPVYLTPLLWGMRVESEKTYEVTLNVGIQLVHGKARYGDVLRMVEEENGTEIRFKTGDLGLGFSRDEQSFSATLPVPAGKYTIQWKRVYTDNWYTVAERYEHDGGSLVTIRF